MLNIKPYTIITGASEGLGKALALECAARGMNLILVALPSPELHQLNNFIRKNYGVEVISIDCDLCDEMSCNFLKEKVHALNIPINMLINNAGIGGTVYFDETKLEVFEKQIDLNIKSTVRLTHLFLPEIKKQSSGYILNVSSLCVFFFLTRKQVYGATKSFIYFFSKSLAMELRKDRIKVSVLCPGGINSNHGMYLFLRKAGFLSRLSVMEPDEIARLAISGLLRGKQTIIPGFLNRLFLLFDKILPAGVKRRMTENAYEKMKSNDLNVMFNKAA